MTHDHDQPEEAGAYVGALGARDYKHNMDLLAEGVRVARAITDSVSDDEIERLKATIARSETMAFLLVEPMEHGAAIDRLDAQRTVIAAIKALRKVEP